MGAAFRAGYEFKRGTLTNDEAKWITVHPNGENGKGRPALIETETGEVLGGMGGKFNGRHISAVRNNGANEQHGAQAKIDRAHALASGWKDPGESQQQRSAAPTAKASKAAPRAKIDLSHPDKIPKEHILQNRDRSSPTSISQMTKIANSPDFYRMSGTRDFGSGAPVVAYGTIPDEQLGKPVKAVLGDGQRLDVQYAVVDSDKVLTSNNAAGQIIEEYYSDDASKTRAIAGNGRMAGITEAYRRGTANQYKREMMEEAADYGIDPAVIEGMKSPVLVRVMQAKDVTADIGDRSNTSGNLHLNAVENAMQDVHRVDLSNTQFYSDGTPTVKSVAEFVGKMPLSEQGLMIDKDGKPTKYAADRMSAAILQKVYGDANVTRMAVQALDPDGKTILDGMMRAAQDVIKLEGKQDGLDVRGLISQAAERAIGAISEGRRLDAEADQLSIVGNGFGGNRDDDLATGAIVQMFSENRRSGARIGEKLSRMAKFLAEEGENREANPFDMFGDIPKRSREDLIREALAQDAAWTRRRMSRPAWDHWQKNGAAVVRAMFAGQRVPRDFFRALAELRKSK